MKRLKEVYESQGWTRKELAKALGVHEVTLWRWETGRFIMRADKLELVCSILEKLPGELK